MTFFLGKGPQTLTGPSAPALKALLNKNTLQANPAWCAQYLSTLVTNSLAFKSISPGKVPKYFIFRKKFTQ